ncbi:SPOR domain-containing protein [Novosphingobium sp.]|uniref:SPOR domain-containing protein n=1 Tax=Novosphingobium sp. TaxID=1874826 RepID=UPI002735FF10|nr:SPOR domain-containing protein [Novosphingobium sp.]MDP3905658.1 SPOR domain-containing protein [Novosphingobium sp.]
MALILLAACGGGGGGVSDLPAAPRSTGPSGDYPMVLGSAYTVEGVTHTPADIMNYDTVGYAGVGADGGAGVSAAHRTLPLPSYVEVTSLDTGKTILVRVERRGPMTNARLVDLSPAAAAQLGLTGGKAAVRVRRVNPPEPERALLRMGQSAPARMDTPQSLLNVLRRRLDGPGLPMPHPGPTIAPTPLPTADPTVAPPVAKPLPKGKIPRVAPEAPPAIEQIAPPPAAAAGSLVVQVGAFGDRARADAVAKRSGGQVTRAGAVWRVRMGPFATQAQAQAALAKAKAAGYSEARIQRAN